jgi:hypothetical protein
MNIHFLKEKMDFFDQRSYSQLRRDSCSRIYSKILTYCHIYVCLQENGNTPYKYTLILLYMYFGKAVQI